MGVIEAPEPLDPSDITDSFKRIVVIVIVTTTLIAGGVAYLESRASARSNTASAAAEQFAIQTLAATSRSQSSGLAEYGAFIQSELAKTSEAVAWRRFLQEDSAAREGGAGIEQEIWAEVAADSRNTSAIDLDGAQGPDADPVFPFRYLAERSRDALVATALQDGSNEESSAWGAMSVTFTAILTTLAVALYLLGSSLAMHRKIGRILAGGGTLLVVVASVWTLLVAGDEPQPQDEAAAEAFADAMVAVEIAHDQASYAHAEQLLTTVIDLRPTFARAYAERSAATFQAGSTQVPGVPSSISDPAAVQRSLNDLRVAQALGYESSQVFNDLGFNLVLLGIIQNRPEFLDEAIGHLQEAIDRDPENPVQRYNRGLALLASGRFDEAQHAYDAALLRTLYTDVTAAEREGRSPVELRANLDVEQPWVTGALTDLQILVDSADAQTAGRASAMKEHIVGSVTRATGELGVGDSDATISDIELIVFAAEVQYEASYDDPGEHDPLWVQWYHRPSVDDAWAALLPVSGPVDQGTEDLGLRAFLPASFPSSCLPVGEYRAEFYSDGNLIAVEDVQSTHEPFRAVVARAVNVGFCRVPAWEASESNINGLVEGYVSPDHTSGLFIMRWPIDPGEDLEAEVTQTLDDMDTFRDLFLPDTVGEIGGGANLDDYFLGLEVAETRDYFYEGGTLRAGVGAGPRDPGSVIIGIIFGPDAMLQEGDTPLGAVIYSSMLLLD